MKQDYFIDIFTLKYIENDWEQIIYRNSTLKARKKKILHCLLNAIDMTRSISDTLLMPNICLAILAKLQGLLNFTQLVNCLKPQYNIAKYADEIFLYLQKNSFSVPGILFAIPFQVQIKATLKVIRTLKKLKYMDDLQIAKEVCLTGLKNQQLIIHGKLISKTKAHIKKIEEVEQKQTKKKNKVYEKVKGKS